MSTSAGPGETAVTVELFGMPCVLAGRRAVETAGRTLSDVAASLALACPALVGPVLTPGTFEPVSGYSFVVDGRFGARPETPVAHDSAILLASSLAGG